VQEGGSASSDTTLSVELRLQQLQSPEPPPLLVRGCIQRNASVRGARQVWRARHRRRPAGLSQEGDPGATRAWALGRALQPEGICYQGQLAGARQQGRGPLYAINQGPPLGMPWQQGPVSRHVRERRGRGQWD
jgi:hypothetical protein